MTSDHADAPAPPLQPLLDAAEVVLRAPTQVWSGPGGDLGAAPIDGIYHGDVRHVRALTLTCDESPIEWIGTSRPGASRIVFSGLLRAIDDAMPDPRVRLIRDRTAEGAAVRERLEIRNGRSIPVEATLRVRLRPEFASLHAVKAGEAEPAEFEVLSTEGSVAVAAGTHRFTVVAHRGEVRIAEELVELEWRVSAPPRGSVSVDWVVALSDDTLVVRPAARPAPWDAPALAASVRGPEPRLARWLATALDDLDALRLALPDAPEDEFYAAGAPWFFTLFGRDSIWAARLLLPVDASIAASTLRVLARLQGAEDDPDSAQEPGKILHELRATTLEIPGEQVVLPPTYYGSVDSTPLWVCLLVDAWRAGMPDDEVRALLPHLRRALTWITEHGDSDGDGFLDYLDRSGRGLANQGWKDSGDSIQWRDGALAQGPIALCEVQGYAYEAVLGGADVLDRFGEDATGLREWAATLRGRFADAYWVSTPEGRYPAVALDRDKRPVDTLTSNIGHLLGTGILDPDDERHVASLLLGESMSSGYGIRTMSTGAGGYWPLSYHGGSVWAHDTAIAAHGMLRAGLRDEARGVVGGLLAAAEGFGYRVPELHSGDPATETAAPTPYPAACRPQAWSAAAAVVAWSALAAG
ncbi:amylo-alpha-1,6-glucosidase [Microbacterium sp. Root53]|uniref:glycogen debranching N-terminal domain-containing protein n=1 Tax=Microbacterium sp. Root53 TaxID=1736553 RepID=UPI0006FFC7A1|nr:glycogen debranching N-terminal domain-containing protein [Microbacterium sp. Root53]KQZ04900.1 amylo-alpha-1,6-glucosidase [Microbacterium sp. Root53]